MRTTMMIAIPVAILMVGVVGALAIVESRPDPEIKVPETVVPLVRVLEVRSTDVELKVASQGTVSPRTESVLVGEVAGRVIEVSPSFAGGGFFEAGQVLLDRRPGGRRLHRLRVLPRRRVGRHLGRGDLAPGHPGGGDVAGGGPARGERRGGAPRARGTDR